MPGDRGFSTPADSFSGCASQTLETLSTRAGSDRPVCNSACHTPAAEESGDRSVSITGCAGGMPLYVTPAGGQLRATDSLRLWHIG